MLNEALDFEHSKFNNQQHWCCSIPLSRFMRICSKFVTRLKEVLNAAVASQITELANDDNLFNTLVERFFSVIGAKSMIDLCNANGSTLANALGTYQLTGSLTVSSKTMFLSKATWADTLLEKHEWIMDGTPADIQQLLQLFETDPLFQVDPSEKADWFDSLRSVYSCANLKHLYDMGVRSRKNVVDHLFRIRSCSISVDEVLNRYLKKGLTSTFGPRSLTLSSVAMPPVPPAVNICTVCEKHFEDFATWQTAFRPNNDKVTMSLSRTKGPFKQLRSIVLEILVEVVTTLYGKDVNDRKVEQSADDVTRHLITVAKSSLLTRDVFVSVCFMAIVRVFVEHKIFNVSFVSVLLDFLQQKKVNENEIASLLQKLGFSYGSLNLEKCAMRPAFVPDHDEPPKVPSPVPAADNSIPKDIAGPTHVDEPSRSMDSGRELDTTGSSTNGTSCQASQAHTPTPGHPMPHPNAAYYGPGPNGYPAMMGPFPFMNPYYGTYPHMPYNYMGGYPNNQGNYMQMTSYPDHHNMSNPSSANVGHSSEPGQAPASAAVSPEEVPPATGQPPQPVGQPPQPRPTDTQPVRPSVVQPAPVPVPSPAPDVPTSSSAPPVQTACSPGTVRPPATSEPQPDVVTSHPPAPAPGVAAPASAVSAPTASNDWPRLPVPSSVAPPVPPRPRDQRPTGQPPVVTQVSVVVSQPASVVSTAASQSTPAASAVVSCTAPAASVTTSASVSRPAGQCHTTGQPAGTVEPPTIGSEVTVSTSEANLPVSEKARPTSDRLEAERAELAALKQQLAERRRDLLSEALHTQESLTEVIKEVIEEDALDAAAAALASCTPPSAPARGASGSTPAQSVSGDPEPSGVEDARSPPEVITLDDSTPPRPPKSPSVVAVSPGGGPTDLDAPRRLPSRLRTRWTDETEAELEAYNHLLDDPDTEDDM